MFDISSFISFGTVALAVGVNSVAVGLGESYIARGALDAINRQPEAKTEINKTALLGLALAETSAIIGLVIAIILVASLSKSVFSLPNAVALIGISMAICTAGFAVGIASGKPAREACLAIARQPFLSNKIINMMLITTSFIQTPIIFSFIAALFIYYQLPNCTTMYDALRLLAAGLSIGIGSIGSIMGLATYAETACRTTGWGKEAYGNVLTFTFISQALIETPIIFALVVSLLLLSRTTDLSLLSAVGALSAAFCTAISNIAPGIGSGKTAAAACKQIALHPQHTAMISKMSMIAQGMLDSFAIYGWAIALFIIFKGP